MKMGKGAIVAAGSMAKTDKESIIMSGRDQKKPKSKLRPVIVINAVNGQGEVIDTVKLDYTGQMDLLTLSIEELLEKHKDTPDVLALPTTGYELNQ